MDNLNKYLLSKMMYVATSMYSISTILLWCLWTYKVKNNNNTKPNPPQAKKKDGLGLKTLIIEPSLPQPPWKLALLPPQPPQRLSSLWATSPPPLLPTVSFELIGTESGDCMMSEIEDYIEFPNSEAEGESCRRTREKSGTSRKFPPPIWLLREAWVLKRECREDGRVVMTLIPKVDGDDVELEFNGEPQEWTHVNDGEREEEEEEKEEEEVALASTSSPEEQSTTSSSEDKESAKLCLMTQCHKQNEESLESEQSDSNHGEKTKKEKKKGKGSYVSFQFHTVILKIPTLHGKMVYLMGL